MFTSVDNRTYFWYESCEKHESLLSNLERQPDPLPVAKDTLTGKEQQFQC
jgi:hypothetical protein